MIDDLVDLAEALAVVAGGKQQAVVVAIRLLSEGREVLAAARDDRERFVLDRAFRCGVLHADGTVNVSTAVELVRVCDLLSRVTAAPAPAPKEADLVFTAPAGVPIESTVRLDLLVADVIRMATERLHVGGPFWNDAGFALLEPVVIPALERGVELDLWLNTSSDAFQQTPVSWADTMRTHGIVREHWYQSEGVSLMHAKFVVADAKRGYLGTANLTSLGMSAHVEIGTELTARQSGQLLGFLMLLDAHDRFAPTPRRPR